MTKFDGSDIKALSSNFYNEHIGYLPQQLMLFTGSVKENIARFNEVDEGKVVEAAKMAGCHDMIMQFPDGYETLAGINGSHLSLGQQQRIGLARALYQNPQYLFLDEPNSNLDGDGDKAFADAITALAAQGKTIVIVAHRTTILNLCNKMLLLKDGQQVMFGPKEEVLKKLNT
jgi:ATP-binding cassette subfamily C exporter for protease/lipase